MIPGKAEIDWEMRPVQHSDAEWITQTMDDYAQRVLLPAMQSVNPDAEIATEVIGEVVGLTPTQDNQAREIIMALTGANTADVVSFGTEAGLFQQLGADVVVCGPGSIEQAHKPDEFVTRGQLEACLALLDKLGHRLADPNGLG